MRNHKFFIVIFLLIISFTAVAQKTGVQEPLVFASQQQQERFNKLTEELRCLVCQNQNLADSDAPLAHDLRREVHEMVLAGRTNQQIKEFHPLRGLRTLSSPGAEKYLPVVAGAIDIVADRWVGSPFQYQQTLCIT